ncbi:hypothetical protein [Marispirochaeta sp.]|uniref:hypothetical protein n=1 Tax=Marispirochaeta sp. TaxID=2038653 RepID=UPI0029C7EB79|nr:hypothetical protein [Marispirochaeta sp.]
MVSDLLLHFKDRKILFEIDDIALLETIYDLDTTDISYLFLCDNLEKITELNQFVSEMQRERMVINYSAGSFFDVEHIESILQTIEDKAYKGLIIETDELCTDETDKTVYCSMLYRNKDLLNRMDFQFWYLKDFIPVKCPFLEDSKVSYYSGKVEGICPRLDSDELYAEDLPEVDTWKLKKLIIENRLRNYISLKKRFTCIECKQEAEKIRKNKCIVSGKGEYV